MRWNVCIGILPALIQFNVDMDKALTNASVKAFLDNAAGAQYAMSNAFVRSHASVTSTTDYIRWGIVLLVLYELGRTVIWIWDKIAKRNRHGQT